MPLPREAKNARVIMAETYRAEDETGMANEKLMMMTENQLGFISV